MKEKHDIMNCNTFVRLRQQLYGTFGRSADALFNLCDALLSEDRARSFPELSQSPSFQRQWPSLYQALQRGMIETVALHRLWVSTFELDRSDLPPVWISVDASSIERPDAQTSEDRGIMYVSNLPRATKPISVGWQFSTLMLLPQQASSWVRVLDQRRIPTAQTAIEVAITQLQEVMPLISRRVILLADRWYATADFLQACRSLGLEVIIRLKSNRRLYRRPPARSHKKGRPPIHGALVQPKREESVEQADEQWSQEAESGKGLRVRRWNQLHFKTDPEGEVSLVHVWREKATGSKRDPRDSWFVLLGATLALEEIALLYSHRFSHEHGYRYLKQDLLWTTVHVRTPDQFELWSTVVGIVMNQLCVARELGQAQYRGWERCKTRVTPRQVRRVMSSILQQVGTPARPCQPRGKSPGRAPGFRPKQAQRYEVVKKGKKEAKTPAPVSV